MSERSLLGLGKGFFALLLCLCAVQASAQERDNRDSHPSTGDKNAPLATTLPDAPSASQEPGEGKQTKRILGIIPNFRAVSVDTHLPPQTPKGLLACAGRVGEGRRHGRIRVAETWMALPIVAFLGACLYRTQTEQQGKKSFRQSKQRTFRH